MLAIAKLVNEPMCQIIYLVEIVTLSPLATHFYIFRIPTANMHSVRRLIAISKL
jgi:hypothetical protein